MSCPAATHKPHQSPRAGDSRSPCPALNTLANHDILPRDGKDINIITMIRAIREAYHLTWALAIFITVGSWILLRKWWSLSLEDLALHNGVEHNASLAHDDAIPEKGPSYAPSTVNIAMLDELLDNSEDGEVFTATDVARARVRREAAYKPGAIDGLHQEIARGEMSLTLGLFGTGKGIPLQDLRVWFQEERFPDGWTPQGKRIGLLETVRKSQHIKGMVSDFRAQEVSQIEYKKRA